MAKTNLKFGKYSPLSMEFEDRKATLADFSIEEKEFNSLMERLCSNIGLIRVGYKTIRRFREQHNKFKYFNNEAEENQITNLEIKKLLQYDKLLDIPIVEAILNPSYGAFVRLVENDCLTDDLLPLVSNGFFGDLIAQEAVEHKHEHITAWCVANVHYVPKMELPKSYMELPVNGIFIETNYALPNLNDAVIGSRFFTRFGTNNPSDP